MTDTNIISFKPKAINKEPRYLDGLDGSISNKAFKERTDKICERLTGPIHFSNFMRSKHA